MEDISSFTYIHDGLIKNYIGLDVRVVDLFAILEEK